jgi:predicted transposase YbfD/YdcC
LYFYFRCFKHSKKTLERAKAIGNDVIVQVKKNQKYLYSDCKYSCSKLTPISTNRIKEKNRNRIETRIVKVYKGVGISSIDWYKWSLVDAIIKVTRIREVSDTKTKCINKSVENSYYISTVSGLKSKTYNKIIRDHWSIENSNHYVRDVSLREDNSRIRCNPFNMAVLRSFALNIMRKNDSSNIQNDRYENSLDINKVLNYIGIREN